MAQEQIMSGEILVIGKDKLKLDLKHGRPDTVLVEFKNQPNVVPCNPQLDELEWDLHQEDGGFILIIKWDVSSARTIIWAVNFE